MGLRELGCFSFGFFCLVFFFVGLYLTWSGDGGFWQYELHGGGYRGQAQA